MSFVFGGRVVAQTVPQNLVDRSALNASSNAPGELEAVASAAAAQAEQRLILERLEARRAALRQQVEDLKKAAAPSSEAFFASSSGAQSKPSSRGGQQQQQPEEEGRATGGALGVKRPRNKANPPAGQPAAASRLKRDLTTKPAHQQQLQAPLRNVASKLSQLPILTTSGDMAFEVTSLAATLGATQTQGPRSPSQSGEAEGGDEAGAPVKPQRLLPVFLLPQVGERAVFVRRIPRSDTAAEEYARKAEAEELLAMKLALGISDDELRDLEKETIELARKARAIKERGARTNFGQEPTEDDRGEGGQGGNGGDLGGGRVHGDGDSDGSGAVPVSQDANIVQRAMREEATGALLPPLGAALGLGPLEALQRQQRGHGKHKHKEPERRHTPRSLRKSQGHAKGDKEGHQGDGLLKADLSASLASYEGFASAVRRDISSLIGSGVPITNPRAAGYMRKWGLTKFQAIFRRMLHSLLGASLQRWRKQSQAAKTAQRRTAYHKYQGTMKLSRFMRNWLLKFVAVAWVKWVGLVERQRLSEWEARRHWAARLVQLHWRAHEAREAVKALRLVLEKERRDKAARRMQTWYNSCRTRWAYNAMVKAKKERCAAVLIQTRIRMVLAKRAVHDRRLVHIRTKAALLLQSKYRAHVASAIVRALMVEALERDAATLIQTMARGRAGRLRVAAMKRRKLEDRAAIVIQRRARGMIGRRRCDELRRLRANQRERLSGAAVLVQKVYRGHRDRIKTEILMAGIRQRKKLENRMATRIASAIRGFLARRLGKRIREGRDEGLIAEAKVWLETKADDKEGQTFFVHSSTGEANYETPLAYVRLDGMLVLSTGKVIFDPESQLTEEERKAKTLEKKCSECEERDATRSCEQCGDKFCAACYTETHSQGARARHVWFRLGHVECAECVGVARAATRWCVVCDDPFCAIHWDDLHSKGGRSRHPYCPIDGLTGALDFNAVNDAGEAQGRFAKLGPNPVGGGDDGLGNVKEGAVKGVQEVDGEEGAVAAAGAWTEAADEEGNPYWFNNETGESSYDNPTGGSGVGEGAKDGGGEVATSGWAEAADVEGNPYWFNEGTGESSYESPF